MKILRNSVRWVIVPSLALLLCGCPYESEFPLTGEDDFGKDDDLIGVWRCEQPEEGASWVVTIFPFNEEEYLIVSQEKEDQSDLLRATVVVIKDKKFLNIREIALPGEAGPWLIANYGISGEKLLVRMIDEELFKKDIDSPADLHKFIAENLENSALYGEDEKVVFTRVTESSDEESGEE